MSEPTSSAAGPNQYLPDAPSGSRVFLIDAMGYIFRAYHALPRLTNRSGLSTHAVYGLNNMMRKLLDAYQPEYVGAVFDLEGPTFRHEAYADYKANREQMPEDLAEQLPYIRRLLGALGIPAVAQPGYEADDVIGALARQAAEQNLEVFIVSSDKDMLQLVAERIWVINPMKDDLLYDRQKVATLLGVQPAQIPDVMALQGDAIDNIPGAPGIGEKGARELIQQYGRVEICLERAAEVTRRNYREALTGYRDQILLSKQLATIDTHVPLALPLEGLRRQEPEREELRSLYQELGFTTLLRDLLPGLEVSRKDYRVLSSESSMQEFIGGLSRDRVVALAVRSDGLPAGRPAQRSLEEALPPTDSEKVALSREPGIARTVTTGLLAELKPWLEDPQSHKAVHDSKSARLALRERGIRLEGVGHDTLLYSYLLDANEGDHRLPSVVERCFGVRLSGTLAEEADWVGQLVSLLEPEVEAAGLKPLYQDMELPLVPVLAEMETCGVRLDIRQLQLLSSQLDKDLAELTSRIYELAGLEFNLNSPKQLGGVLFEKMGLPAPRKRGKSKGFSTAVDVLEDLASQHEVPRLVLEYRQLAKLKSTYVDTLPELVNPATGRLHTSYNQAGTATGRLSSSNPNLQNIPIRTELGRQIRAAFVAEKGYVLLAADYSQIELRLLAHFSEDPVLAEAFRHGEDIHELTASTVFGVPPEQQTPEHRRRAKAINYGIVYGLSPFGLAQQLGISKDEAEEFIHQYFHRYPGVRKFIDSTLEEVRRTGLVRTLSGRMRRIPDIHSKDVSARHFAERTAVNTPLQGSAADLIKLAMIRVHRELLEQGLTARLILQVHDELVLETPQGEIEFTVGLLREALEQVYPLRVPLVADVAVGPNWRDMDEVSV